MPSDSLILAGGFGPGYCSMLSSRTENCYLKKYTDTNMHFKDGISSLPRTETDPQGRKNCWWRICKWHHFKCSGVTLPPRWKCLWDDVMCWPGPGPLCSNERVLYLLSFQWAAASPFPDTRAPLSAISPSPCWEPFGVWGLRLWHYDKEIWDSYLTVI